MKKTLLSIGAVVVSCASVFAVNPPSPPPPPPGGGYTTFQGTIDEGPNTPVIVNPKPPFVGPMSVPVVFMNPMTCESTRGSLRVSRYQYFQIQFESTRYISQIEVTDMTTGSSCSYDYYCFVQTADVFYPIGVGRWKISVITRLMGMTEVIETEILINDSDTGYVIPLY